MIRLLANQSQENTMSFGINPIRVMQPAAKPTATPGVNASALRTAADIYKAKGQSNNAAICMDMATKLARFGSFVSEKQAAFAGSLVAKAGALAQADAAVRDAGIAQRAAQPTSWLSTPDLFAVMQKHSRLIVGGLKIARKNQDSLCWLIDDNGDDTVIGKIENGAVTLFAGRMRGIGVEQDTIVALLREIEANPLAAAVKYGKLSGRCCSCGRDLTADGSIEAGIGPICALKFSL
jgi:hypothetical protein